MFSDDALEGLEARGVEIKSLAAHLELMLINVGSRYPVSDFNHQPIRRLIQLIFTIKTSSSEIPMANNLKTGYCFKPPG